MISGLETPKSLAMGPTLGRRAQCESYSALGGLSQALLAALLGSGLVLPVRHFPGRRRKQIEKQIENQEYRLKRAGRQIAPEKPEVHPS